MIARKEIRKRLYGFFEEINLATAGKSSGVSKTAKIEQILAYLEIIKAQLRRYARRRELVLVECGAGNCYLSLLIYHYYTAVEKRPVAIHCIDTSERLMTKKREIARSLGFDRMFFHGRDIEGYRHEGRLDLVYSLHACDTATDKALHLGWKYNARSILSVSCCQHAMKKTMRGGSFTGITRHRVFKDKLVYLVGDSMRALLLGTMGYKVDMIDFVSSRYTDKNIMLRARKAEVRNRAELVREYLLLKRSFCLTRALEHYLLGTETNPPELAGASRPFRYPTVGTGRTETPIHQSQIPLDLDSLHSWSSSIQCPG